MTAQQADELTQAIQDLQDERDALRAELEQVRRERDEAIRLMVATIAAKSEDEMKAAVRAMSEFAIQFTGFVDDTEES